MSFGPPVTTAVPCDDPGQMDSPSCAVHRLRIADSSPEGSTLSLPDAAGEAKAAPAAPQGRRRHRSETGSPAGAAAGAAPGALFCDSRRQTWASSDSVCFKAGEGASGWEPKMSRVTSAGFQNGLNYIALSSREAAAPRGAAPAAAGPRPERAAAALDSGTYVSIDFSKDDLFKCTSAKKE